MKRNLFLIAVMITSGLLNISAIFANPFIQQSDNLKPFLIDLVNKASTGKAVYINHFEGPEGLTGIILKGLNKDSKEIIGWNPKGSNLLFIGSVVDLSGKDITQIAVEYYISSKQDQEINEKQAALIKDLNGFRYIETVTSSKVASVVIDPACLYCQEIINQIELRKEEFSKKGMSVEIIPIGTPNTPYVKEAANILSFGPKIGKIKPLNTADPQKIALVNYNTEKLTEAFPDLKTPLIILDNKIVKNIDILLGEGVGNDS